MTDKPETVLTREQVEEMCEAAIGLGGHFGQLWTRENAEKLRNMALRSAEAGRDTKRYRWLRESRSWDSCFSVAAINTGKGMAYYVGSRWVGEALDAAIDAAMEGK